MAQFKAALWDMDGTLCFTKPGVVHALDETLEILGLMDLKPENIDIVIGPPIQLSFQNIFHLPREEAIDAGNLFRKIYREKDYVLEAEPYDGVRETLIKLRERGVKNAVATLKKQDMAERICNKYGIYDLFDVVYGSDDKDILGKHDLISMCCRDFQISDSREAVMIGDSKYDAEGAILAGSSFLGVTYGFGFHEESDLQPYPHIGAAKEPLDILDFF